jgi:hypothetical protein
MIKAISLEDKMSGYLLLRIIIKDGDTFPWDVDLLK